MKQRWEVSFLAVLLLCLAALPARAAVNVNQDTFVLSNEGTNGFISQTLASGYGNLNLYQTLVQFVEDTNPSFASIITPTFLKALHDCPPGAAIFTTQLKNVSIGSQGVAISTDGTVQVVSVFGSTYYNQPGTATLGSDLSGVGRALCTHPASAGTYLTSWQVSGGPGVTTTYNVFAIGWAPPSTPPATPAPPSLWLAITGCLLLLGYALWTRRRAVVLPLLLLCLAALPARAQRINVNQDTFVISDEAPGFLITKLIAAGHGGDSVFQATVYLASMPGAGAILTPAFLNALATCPPTSEIFTTTVAQVTAQGISVSISTDGTARFDDIEAISFVGTHPVIQTGNGTVQNVRMVYSTNSAVPLNTNVVQGPLFGMTTSYRAFAVAWALPDSPPATPAPPSLWLAITGCLLLLGYMAWSRRRAAVLPLLLLSLAALPARAQVQSFALTQGPGKLVDSLIAAGYGDFSLYQALLAIRDNANPSVAGVLTPSFLNTLASCPAGSQIFTNHLSAYAGSAVLVSTDCTAVPTRFANGSGQNGAAGNSTLAIVISGVSAPAAIVSSATPLYIFDATGDYGCVTPSTCHNVFAIAYAPQGPSQTFVLSDEAPGHLITNLVAAGWGDYNLYDALIALQANSNPSLAGVITDAFLLRLAGCAAGKPVFTIQLKDVTGTVAITDDGTVQSRNLQGSTFSGQPGITTRVYDLSGIGPATTVSSTNPQTPLNSWSQNVTVGASTATVTYNVFAILYTPGSAPTATPAPPSLILVATGGLALLGRRLWRRRRA